MDLTTTSSALTPNGVFDLGLQANKHFALYGHFMFGTLISTSHAAAHGIVELPPVHWLSIGTGLGYEAYYMGFDFDFCGCKREEVGPQRVNKSFDGPTIPLLLGFNIGDLDAWNRGGRRSVLRITAEGSTGIDFTDSTIGGRGSLSFGGSWM